jgi:hypothetical protein
MITPIAMAPAERLLLTAGEFRALGPPSFRRWLKENDLSLLEAILPAESQLKPSDLVEIIYDDGPEGFKATIQDEVGAPPVKLSTISRLRKAFAEAAKIRQVEGRSATPSSRSQSKPRCSGR